MKRLTLLIFVITLAGLGALVYLNRPAPRDDADAQTLRVANQLYTNRQYGDAVQIYEQLVDSGVRNADVYYNLGNAYFKNGELGQAIANYRRAEMLTPRDPLVRANLEFVLARREDKPMQARTLPLVAGVLRVYRVLSLNEWLIAGILLYTLACSLWILRTRRPGHGRSTAWLWTWRTSLALRGC